MEKPLYQLICENIRGGVLPDDFSLPDENESGNGIRWAPGAMDGVSLYHAYPGAPDDAGMELMARALKAAASGAYTEAERLFAEFSRDQRAVGAADSLQKYILDHENELDAGHIYRTGFYLACLSPHAECVKIGLELLELFSITEETDRNIIRRLALCDEFSLYAVWNMRHWDDGNRYIFELAKKVHGWGRIHAVEYLEPETEEIRHWLLTEGTVNDIENDYSALTCWQKSGAEQVLAGDPTGEEYKGLSVLIAGLISEGPVSGISGIENAEEILLRFLQITPDHELTGAEYEVILSIREWADDEDHPFPAVSAACGEILRSPACAAAVRSAVKEGNCLGLAQELDIPFRAELFACMERDPDRYYYYIHYLTDDPVFFEKTLDLFREKLPLAEMGGDPVGDPGFGAKYRKYDQLQTVLQNLADKPLTGTDLIAAGLRSPLSRNRIWALMCLRSWVQAKALPLADLSPELYAAVSALRPKEISEDCLKIIAPLLSGRTTFPSPAGD